jgi:hypothetical protein
MHREVPNAPLGSTISERKEENSNSGEKLPHVAEFIVAAVDQLLRR